MKINLSLIFLIVPLFLIYSQNRIPAKKTLFGKWVIEADSDYANTKRIYLTNPDLYANSDKNIVEFFTGEFTGKLKIRYFLVKTIRHCGVGYPYNSQMYIGTNEAIWDYDNNTGELIVIHPISLKETLFRIEQEHSSELILTKIR